MFQVFTKRYTHFARHFQINPTDTFNGDRYSIFDGRFQPLVDALLSPRFISGTKLALHAQTFAVMFVQP